MHTYSFVHSIKRQYCFVNGRLQMLTSPLICLECLSHCVSAPYVRRLLSVSPSDNDMAEIGATRFATHMWSVDRARPSKFTLHIFTHVHVREQRV